MTGLGDLAGGLLLSAALAVTPDGSVVVGDSTSASGNEAFRWTAEGGMVGLGDLTGGDFFSRANAVSADGSIVVGESVVADGLSREPSDTVVVGMGRHDFGARDEIGGLPCHDP